MTYLRLGMSRLKALLEAAEPGEARASGDPLVSSSSLTSARFSTALKVTPLDGEDSPAAAPPILSFGRRS